MFRFTTERIINSLETGSKMGLRNSDGKRVTFFADAANKVFSVYGGANFYKAGECGVVSVKASKRGYHAPKEEVLTLDFNKTATVSGVNLEKGDVLRLSIYTWLQDDIRSTYNDVNPIHIKPFIYEVKYASTVSDTLDSIISTIKEINGLSDIVYFEATKDGTNLVLTAPDYTTRFFKVEFARVNAEADKIGNILTGFKDTEEILCWNAKTAGSELVKGTTGAGTVEHILHDLRIQTRENTDVFTINMDERPLPGGKYNQYFIEYTTVEKEHVLTALGATSNSTTYHVFFVEKGVAKAFETALKTVTDGNAIDLVTTDNEDKLEV